MKKRSPKGQRTKKSSKPAKAVRDLEVKGVRGGSGASVKGGARSKVKY